MTTPTFFTVVADFKSVVTDVFGDGNYAPELGVVTGNVSFTPLITPHSIVRAPNAEPRPLGLLPARIQGFIDTDGRLKLYEDPEQARVRGSRNSDNKTVADNPPYDYSPVQLLADTDYLELGGKPLYYRVTFSDVTYNGQDRKINSFTFQAPPAAVELNLITLLGSGTVGHAITPPTGSISILPTSVRVENKTMIFTVQGVDIPDPLDVRGFGELTAVELETVRQELLKRIKVVDDKVVATNPQTGESLFWDGAKWVNAGAYTRAEIDSRLSGLASGLARKPAVLDILDTPPPAPNTGDTYIIGKNATGDWAGHDNSVVFWDGASWQYSTPTKGDTHTDLSSNVSMTWNETDWVSVGSQASKLGELDDVTVSAVPNSGDSIQWDGAKWVNRPIPKFPLDELTDVSVFGVNKDQVLQFNGTEWVPGSLPGQNLDSLTDVDIPAPVAGDLLSYDVLSGSWVGVQPTLANPSLGALSDVDVATAETDNLLSYDDVTKTWLSTSQLTVDSVSLTSGTVEAVVEDIADAADELTAVPNVKALKDYVSAEKADIRLEELLDCTELSGAVAGQVPVWSDTNDRWEPSTPAQSLKGLSDVLLNTPTDKTVLSYQTLTGKWEAWGLSLDELADCNDLSTATDGQVVSWDNTRRQWVPISPVRGGGTFASLTDVDVTTVPPTDGQLLKFNATTSKWEPVAAPYTKTEVDSKVAPLATTVSVDSKISTLVIGLEHGVAVQSLTNTPPATPVADEFYIVGSAGTGAWAGHNNAVTYWDGATWQFAAPQANESHLVEDQQATFHWNGTAWVKVATAAVGGPSAVGDLWAVGSIQQSLLTESQFRTALGLNSAEDRKWVLADGRDVTGSQYATITGRTNVPDLRGAFLRMAGTNAGNTSWVGGALMAWQEDNTARPKTAFTTDSQGSHTHTVWSRRMSYYSGAGYSAALGTLSEGINAGGTVSTDGRFMDPDGAHTHTITGGGDTETRPKNMSVNYFIKVN